MKNKPATTRGGWTDKKKWDRLKRYDEECQKANVSTATESAASLPPTKSKPKQLRTKLSDGTRLPFRLVRKQRDIDTGFVNYIFTFGDTDNTSEVVIDGASSTLHLFKTEFNKRGIPLLQLTAAQLTEVLGKRVLTEEITHRLGWLRDKQTFIAAHAAFGNATGVRFIPQLGTANVVGKQMGSLDAYLAGLAGPLKVSYRMTYAYAIGLTAPLCSYLELDGSHIVNFSGKTSAGKSLTASVAQSITGRAGRTDLVTMNLTEGGFERYADEYQALALPFNDLKDLGLDGKPLLSLIRKFAFAFGAQQSRASQVAGSSKRRETSIALTAFECGISEYARQHNYSFQGGDEIRIHDIHFAPSSEGGAFDNLEVRDDGNFQTQRDQVAKTISQNYGVVLPRWIDHIRAASWLREEFEGHRSSFKRSLGRLDVPAERVVDRMSLVVASGCIAASVGLMPCDAAHVMAAGRAMFEEIVSQQSSRETAAQAVVEQLRDLVLSGTFRRYHSGMDQQTFYKFGYEEVDANGARKIFINGARLKKIAGNRATMLAVLQLLYDDGALETGGRRIADPKVVTKKKLKTVRVFELDYNALVG